MGPLLLWHDLHQVELNLDWIGVLRQTNPLAYPLDMGIYNDPGYSKSIPQDDIGCLSSYPRQGDHFLKGFWNLSSKSSQQLLATFLDTLCLIPIESRWPDVLFQFRHIGVCIILSRTVFLKKICSHLVHFDVGALGREDR